MTQLSSNRTARLGRIFPERQPSAEEKAKRKVEREKFNQRCQVIFERVRPELIDQHYDWFIIIEPDSGEYIIDPDEAVARAKARDKFGHTMRLMLRINGTGCCGRI